MNGRSWMRIIGAICMGVVSSFSNPAYTQEVGVPKDAGVSTKPSDDSPVSTVTNALRFLDSHVPEDLEWSEGELEKLAAVHAKSSNILYAVALVQFGLGEYQKSNRSLQALSGPGLLPEVRSFSGMLQLYVATILNDKPQAERLFVAMSEASLRETLPLQDRKRYAASIGELVGFLETEVAKSPIDLKLILKSKADVSHCGNVQVEQAFKNTYSSASARTARFIEILKETESTGLEGLEEKLKVAESALIQKQEESILQRENVEETRESISESTKQLRLERKQAEAELRLITAESKQQTPGHPGQPIQVPPRPDVNRIQVNEFETVLVVDSKGKQSTVLQRRPQFEIDRERRLQLQILMAEYDRLVELNRNYQSTLARWEKADRDRRRELLDRKVKIQDAIRGLTAEIDRLSSSTKSVALEFREVRDEEKQLRAEIEILSDLVLATKSKKPESAFRPLRLRADDIGYQKSRLLKLLGES